MKCDNPKITRNEKKKKQRELIPSNFETKTTQCSGLKHQLEPEKPFI